MKKALQIIAIILLILIDLTFIELTIQGAWGQKESIDRYFWFQKYASEIECEFDGKINVNQVTDGEIVFRFSSETSPADCITVVKKLSEWRQVDERLDNYRWIYFCEDGSEVTKHTLLFPRGYSERGLTFCRMYSDNCAFDYLYIHPYLNEEFYMLSSYKDIEENLVLLTDAFIALDDEWVLSKITEWRCNDDLYTEEQLAVLEARGIPMTVWEEEDAA